jgi:nickel-dependent lactate racemase
MKTQINTSKKYDLVIASPGGNPKDINFYQAQKAISNACMFTKNGGVIIVIAACEEGSGNQEFEEFIDGTDSLEDMMNKFAANPFRLGPHKAFLLGLQSINHHIILVSSLPGSLVEKLYIRSASCFDDALSQAQKIIGSSPQVAVLPFATHCIPAQELHKTG